MLTLSNSDEESSYNLEQKKDHLIEQDFLKLLIIKSKKIGDGMKALVKSFNLRPISFL